MHEPTKVCTQCGHLALYNVVVCPSCKKVFEQQTAPNNTAYVSAEVDLDHSSKPEETIGEQSSAANQEDSWQAIQELRAQQALAAEKAMFKRKWLEKYGSHT